MIITFETVGLTKAQENLTCPTHMIRTGKNRTYMKATFFYFTGWEERAHQMGYPWRNPNGSRNPCVVKSVPFLLSSLTEIEC